MKIFDFHNDFLTNENTDAILKKYESGNNKIVSAVFRGKRDLQTCLKIADKFLEKKPNNCLLSFEDVGFDEENAIEEIIKRKPICVTQTWNYQNKLASGCYEVGGLTKLGKKAVMLLSQNGIFIDVAHLNKQGILETLDLSDKVVDSHTCFLSVCDSRRNLDFETLKKLENSQAMIGLCLYAPFVSAEKIVTANDVFKQIDWFCQRFAIEKLCFGTDFFGAEDFPQNFNDYDGTGFYELINLLLKVGYSEKDVEGIFFDNLQNFLQTKK